jgi:hypothetical protein
MLAMGESPLPHAPAPLVTPTYDGSGQAVHPDIAYFPAGWHGWAYWLVITPYPGDNVHMENPSVLVSADGLNWREPAGIANPVALPQITFLADGDLCYAMASDSLWVYYVEQKVDRQTHVLRKTSADGVVWGPQVTPLAETVCGAPDYELLSPAVAAVEGGYGMWSVNTGRVGCHAPTTKIEYRGSCDGCDWSAPVDVTFDQPGYWPWHLDVTYVSEHHEFWAFVSAFPEGGSCHNTVLFFARSADGLHWTTYPRPALAAGPAGAWDCGEIYRATLVYDGPRDLLRVWYSANDGPHSHWRIGYTERMYTEFLNSL